MACCCRLTQPKNSRRKNASGGDSRSIAEACPRDRPGSNPGPSEPRPSCISQHGIAFGGMKAHDHREAHDHRVRENLVMVAFEEVKERDAACRCVSAQEYRIRGRQTKDERGERQLSASRPRP